MKKLQYYEETKKINYLKKAFNLKLAYTAASAFFVGGICFVIYGINQTKNHLSEIVNTNVLNFKRRPEYIYINDVNLDVGCAENCDLLLDAGPGDWIPSLQSWWERRKKLYLWRLVEMSNSELDKNHRRRALETLASYNNLHDYEYQEIAQACNAQTAAALAQFGDVNLKYFLKPYSMRHTKKRKELVDAMRDILVKLCKSSRHSCLNYFLSRVFPKLPKYKAWSIFSDLDTYGFAGTPPITISDESVLPLCIEALVHHCTVSGDAKSIVDAGALQLLFECHKVLSTDMDSNYRIGSLLLELSTHPDLLQDFFQTGWVYTFALWISGCDSKLSTLAGSSLANLSGNELKAKYGKEVVLLHPSHRNKEEVKVDVILIHGLLGSIHYTWRQRGQRREPFSLFGIGSPGEALLERAKSTSLVIDEAPQEMLLGDMDDQEDPLDSDYVFVMTDIPESESLCTKTSCSLDCMSRRKMEEMRNAEYTTCWPKDWLPKDCKHLRIIGVNYESRISDWTHWCPLRDRGSKRFMADKCRRILQQLTECGVGDRPIVWLAHSMGGLMLKHILMQAWKSSEDGLENVCKNTRAIAFFSTPHIGSPWASLHDAWRFFFLPSTEVDELKYKSPALEKLHKDFLKFVEEFPIETISFVETKSLKISSFEWEFHCVPPKIGDTGTGVIYEIPLGHLDICKPDGKFSFVYQRILSLVRSAVCSCKKVHPQQDKNNDQRKKLFESCLTQLFH